MRAAPPVAFEARTFVAWRAAVGLAAFAAAAAVGGWMALGASPVVGGGLLVVVVACAAMLWRQRPFELGWDGTGWSMVDGSGVASGRLDVMIDLGPCMLLRWRGDGRLDSRWLPVQARDGVSGWRTFRAAVYARSLATPAMDRGVDG